MPTTLDETPAFVHIIRGAPLVVVAELQQLVEEVEDVLEDDSVRTLVVARFRVEDVLAGDPDAVHVDVTLVPDLAVIARNSTRVVLALCVDNSREADEPRFVPYFSSVLPLSDDDRIDRTQADKRQQQAPGSLDEIREVIARLAREREEETRHAELSGESPDTEDERDNVGEIPPRHLRDSAPGEAKDILRAEASGSRPAVIEDEQSKEE